MDEGFDCVSTIRLLFPTVGAWHRFIQVTGLSVGVSPVPRMSVGAMMLAFNEFTELLSCLFLRGSLSSFHVSDLLPPPPPCSALLFFTILFPGSPFVVFNSVYPCISEELRTPPSPGMPASCESLFFLSLPLIVFFLNTPSLPWPRVRLN